MIILCTVDITTREVTIPSDQRIASYDHKVDVIRFQVETIPGFSLDTSSIRIAAQGPNKARHDYAVDPSTVQIEEETGYITFDWPIPAGVTEMPIGTFKYGDKGQLIFAVCAEIISGDTVSKAWHSDDGIITVVAHLEPESGGGEDPEEEATNAQKIGQLQTDVAVVQREVSAVAGGTPTVVDSKSAMTEHDKIYILSSDGKWYYYSATAEDWLVGGTYGGAVTDSTLSLDNVPANSKTVGDTIDALDDRVTALESGSSGGLTADIKAALLACFANVAWAGNDGQDFYDALESALNPPANLSSITCVYTQSGTVYDTASLDDLKPDLVVTAHWSDNTTSTITTYTLSGTLTVGTSTITVTYGGKTTTFTVVVQASVITVEVEGPNTTLNESADVGTSYENCKKTNTDRYCPVSAIPVSVGDVISFSASNISTNTLGIYLLWFDADQNYTGVHSSSWNTTGSYIVDQSYPYLGFAISTRPTQTAIRTATDIAITVQRN